MASAVIAELLKQSPDITAAEAQLAAIEATGAKPTPDLHRAKNMYMAVKSYKPAATKARWWHDAAARRKPQARESLPPATLALVRSERPCEGPAGFVYGDGGNVIETHEHKGEFKEL